MSKTLVIHIGDPKTGTSSIQRVLMDRAYESPDVSIDYQPYLNAFQLANSVFDADSAVAKETLFAEIATWLDNSDTDISIISAELFFRVDPVALQAALEQYLPDHAASARIISYVRPHAARFLSQFVQISKTGTYWGDMGALFERMAKKDSLLYTARFSKWRETFGERFTLRPMVRDELFKGDVVADFFHTALNGASYTLLPTSAVNESPSAEVLAGVREMHRVLNKRGTPADMRQTIGQFMVNKLNNASKGAGTKLRISRPIYDKIVAHCQDDAVKMDAAFFGKPILATALEMAAKDVVETEMSMDVSNSYSEESLVKLRRVSQRLAKLMNENGDLWRTRFFRDIKQRPDSQALRQRCKRHQAELKGIQAALSRVTTILTGEFKSPTEDAELE